MFDSSLNIPLKRITVNFKQVSPLSNGFNTTPPLIQRQEIATTTNTPELLLQRDI